MPGTITKNGDRVEVFRTGERVSIEYMNSFVPDSYKIEDIKEYKSTLSLAKAKELYPEWYEKRIVKGEPRDQWVCNRGLYDWWRNRIEEEIKEGHRYYALMILSIYAIKCNISEEELRTDCYGLMKQLNELTKKPNNDFTENDVESAIQIFYDKGYVTYPRNSIAHLSGLRIEPNKRNGRTRENHLKVVNEMRKFKRDVLNEPSYEKNGRPSAEKLVKDWRKDNPDGKKSDCIKELNLSKPTVYKWWE
jgi:hypothetical protein